MHIYTSDEPDALAVVLGAESPDELIDLLDMQLRALHSDSDLVSQIAILRARVTKERARAARLRQERAAETEAIERQTSKRCAAFQSLVARRDSLANLRSSCQRSLASVQVQRRQWEQQADALEAESARVASVVAAPPPGSDDHLPTPTGQGQPIAAVGCTGHCFGDHVNFEVRVGGSPVDPMGYL